LSSPEVTRLEGAGYTSVQFLTGEAEATFPEEGMIVDHVLVGKGLTATDIDVPEAAASDHLPVIVTIRRQ
jgi:endonuclease/exonuclease/phosphatase family metal-dependent hydrolase